MTIRIEEEIYLKFKQCCDMSGKTMSGEIREAIGRKIKYLPSIIKFTKVVSG